MATVADTVRQDPTDPTQKTNLSGQQIEALAALTTGSSITAAAKRVGVHRCTIYDWLNRDEEFSAEFNRIKHEAVEAVQSELRGLSRQAVATLHKLLSDESVPASVRLKTAVTILQGSLQHRSPTPGRVQFLSSIQRLSRHAVPMASDE